MHGFSMYNIVYILSTETLVGVDAAAKTIVFQLPYAKLNNHNTTIWGDTTC